MVRGTVFVFTTPNFSVTDFVRNRYPDLRREPTSTFTQKMADPIDPRLQYTSLPPRAIPQSYTASSTLQNNGAARQPYYLPATNHQHAPPSTALDPALEEPSPGLQEASTDNENDADGDHDE